MSRKELLDIKPEGFQPIDPWKSEDLVVKRRNLPHLEAPGATYFVTFRCRSGIQLPPRARDLLMATIQGCNEKSIDLDAAVVMPDHAHAIFRLIGSHKLSQVLQQIKGRSARQINQIGRGGHRLSGPLWMDESFDHIIRQEAELEEKIEYIRKNPAKNGLVITSDGYQWLFVRKLTG